MIGRSTRPLPRSRVGQAAEVEMTAKLNWGPVLSVLPRGASALRRGWKTCFPTSGESNVWMEAGLAWTVRYLLCVAVQKRCRRAE